MEFVRKNLGNVISIPDGVKGMRFDPKMIKKYDSTASQEIFWEWLRSVIYGYRITQLGGQERDEERLFILDSLLDGKAKQWFQYRLDQHDKSTPTFLEMIIDIYNHFIHDSALQDARQAFKDAKWEDANESVEGWKDLIKQLVDDMDIQPDEYSIKSKFMEGLPRHIQTWIFTDKMSVKYNDLEELYQARLDVEYALRAERRFAKSAKAYKSMDDHAPQKILEIKVLKTNNFGIRRRFQPSQPHQVIPNQAKVQDRPPPAEKRVGPAPRPTKPRIQDMRGAGSNDKRNCERITICFRCGNEGHITSSQECPDNGKKPSYVQI